MQVYRYMDIGTAKSRSRESTHHLIDIVEPHYQFSAGEFVRRADGLVSRIIGSGRVPVLAGGTAFYLKCFACGLPETPGRDMKVRRELLALGEKKGYGELYTRLKTIDPQYASAIGPKDHPRIVRALEVYAVTGTQISAFSVPTVLRNRFCFLMLGLMRNRAELYRRIDRRVELMFQRGLVDEVKELLKRGYGRKDPGMRGIGYREFFRMQEGCFGYSDLKEMIKRNTRRYAKRQITFFKSLPEVTWRHPDDRSGLAEEVSRFLCNDR
jgi:tRNA dimethylallyltransferase